MGVEKIKRGVVIVAVVESTIHERCKYIPNIWYCFAPKAWPQRVSVALDMPTYNRKEERKKNKSEGIQLRCLLINI